MQWSNELSAGFSSNMNVKTWLKIPETYKNINVKNENDDPNSLLNFYKRLLKIRRDYIALQDGKFEFMDLGKINEKCMAYKRIHESQLLFIYLNFTDKSIDLPYPKQESKLIFSTNLNKTKLKYDSKSDLFKIDGYEGFILE